MPLIIICEIQNVKHGFICIDHLKKIRFADQKHNNYYDKQIITKMKVFQNESTSSYKIFIKYKQNKNKTISCINLVLCHKVRNAISKLDSCPASCKFQTKFPPFSLLSALAQLKVSIYWDSFLDCKDLFEPVDKFLGCNSVQKTRKPWHFSHGQFGRVLVSYCFCLWVY